MAKAGEPETEKMPQKVRLENEQSQKDRVSAPVFPFSNAGASICLQNDSSSRQCYEFPYQEGFPVLLVFFFPLNDALSNYFYGITCRGPSNFCFALKTKNSSQLMCFEGFLSQERN